ncbi:hypothetical protein ACP70R_049957 [Stipagrostis hirtigluma subsp. patula]
MEFSSSQAVGDSTPISPPSSNDALATPRPLSPPIQTVVDAEQKAVQSTAESNTNNSSSPSRNGASESRLVPANEPPVPPPVPPTQPPPKPHPRVHAMIQQPVPVSETRAVVQPRKLTRSMAQEAVFRDKCIMPVNIKMIHDASANRNGGPLVINRTEITTVRVYGKVFDVKQTGERGSFKIYDGTAVIKASIWLVYSQAQDEAFKKLSDSATILYAMVHGRVVFLDDGPALEAYDCRPVTDTAGPEMVHHHLSVIKAYLDLTVNQVKKPPSAPGMTSTDNVRRVQQIPAPVSDDSPPAADNVGQTEGAMSPPRTRDPSPPILGEEDEVNTVGTKLSNMVLDVIRKFAPMCGREGVCIADICAKTGADEGQIRSALQSLASIGEVYSTVDESHFRPT